MSWKEGTGCPVCGELTRVVTLTTRKVAVCCSTACEWFHIIPRPR